jgi:hypothetical protein
MASEAPLQTVEHVVEGASLGQCLIARAPRGRRRLDRGNLTQDQAFEAVKTSMAKPSGRVQANRLIAFTAAALSALSVEAGAQGEVAARPGRGAAGRG